MKKDLRPSLDEMFAAVERERLARIERAKATGSQRIITLPDLYEPADMVDEEMGRWVRAEDWDREFLMHEMTAEEARSCTNLSGEPIVDAYHARADDDRQRIVCEKIANYDANRVILLHEKVVLDGWHHLVAAIQTGNLVKYIDLAD